MLAIELILEALDYLTIPLELSFPLSIDEHKPKHAALSACSLVCKDWSYFAQRLLFRRVIIRADFEKPFSVSSYDTFLSAIDPHTEKGAWLASSIRMFIFFPRKDDGGGAVSSQLLTALLRMPNLRHFDVFAAVCTFSDAQLAQLRAEGPKLNSLRINVDRWTTTPETVDPETNMYRLAACFPSLKVLDIGSIRGSTLRPASPPLNLPLTALTITLFRIANSLEACIACLVRNPEADYNGLQVLSTHARQGRRRPGEEESLVQTYGPTLLSLTVDFNQYDTLAMALQQCTRLKRLELANFPTPALLPLLPRTLEDLSMSSGRTSSYESGVEFPDLGPLMTEIENLPRLRKLTISYCGDNEPHFDALRVVCRQRGIELRTSNGIYINGDDFMISVQKDLLELNLTG
ncbi:hypothetical protein GYMLUDRAFT_503955 [Collybiopsis luxurians FD-317 M1]|uniref:F-box domain-containing protein n=1 Tax=Collybiopsis luxurians FD-317 M1 TaxID=944289 RepID=A0A0D0C360_9AGAR|nr:hypothetical protein GYMLUDRAFT_503955 [Collybiopsis luxurians FD-317 M1]